ncbi:hypothetical protein [Streptomyces bohaiensis]|uniref:hypothetical protein n=1 Tax=Streptomyces bohaiensis TaxID=1431344 RepID=UPI003B7DC3CE
MTHEDEDGGPLADTSECRRRAEAALATGTQEDTIAAVAWAMLAIADQLPRIQRDVAQLRSRVR